jgi:cell division protein FtsW
MFSFYNRESRFLFSYFIYLLLAGTLCVLSSSIFLSEAYYSTPFFFYKKQIIGMVISIFVCLFVSCFPANFFYKKSFYIFSIIIILNLLLFIPGLRYEFHGVPRWLKFSGFLFQPAELLKVGFLLYIAHLFTYYVDQISFLLLRTGIAFFVTIILLYYQSDFGTTMLICGLYLIFLWNFSYKKKFLLYFLGAICIILFVLIFLKPYRIMRILTFLNPWEDKLKSGFQIIQSFIAIKNGGFWGVGLGLSRQKRLFLPMAHSDFIFSIILEESGFIGGIILLGSILFFSYLFIHFSFREESLFKKNYLFGVGFVLFSQTVINVAGVTGLIPLKGIGLPFISYGVSSLIGFGIIIGIALSLLNEKN